MQEKQISQLNAKQLSLILNISERTVKHLAKNKELPCIFKNRRPLFTWNELVNHFQKLEGGAA